MYSFFENLLKPFPNQEPGTPPKSLVGFCIHYAQGSRRHFLALAAFTALPAIIEVSLYGFAGDIVDWLQEQDRETLFKGKSGSTLMLSLGALIALPATIFLQSLFMHQTLLGNFPMRIRWLAHRHLLKQSLTYYQSEFSGRLAMKVMQPALAVRDTLIKILDVILYVAVYFVSSAILIFSLAWRLALLLFTWLASYTMVRYLCAALDQAIWWFSHGDS